ncbi:MAG: acyl-CoA thioesterase [Chitinophagaceae bacterium]|nr:acyl-CoA thioesterase [Chitinophagaceae bacterium]MCW5928737.1 acyl-CoA thioesterase [Chitinophagaceae bacterium]
MFYYWYRIVRILIARNFHKQVAIEDELTRTFSVRFFDCDGLRVMAAFKYAAYMDFIRWELIARSKLYNEIVLKGLAPTLGSQKIIYRKPLKLWTKFSIRLSTVGWDDKWVYNVHKFEQGGEIKAIGVTRALIWRKDKPQILMEILKNIGVTNLKKNPPEWVLTIFQNDKEIIANDV